MSKRLCLEEHELLQLVAEETTDPDVAVHLAGCPTCRERLERLRSEVRVLRRAGTKPEGSSL